MIECTEKYVSSRHSRLNPAWERECLLANLPFHAVFMYGRKDATESWLVRAKSEIRCTADQMIEGAYGAEELGGWVPGARCVVPNYNGQRFPPSLSLSKYKQRS